MREMINLLHAVRALRLERREKTADFERQIAAIDAAIDVVGKVNEACPECEGRGWRLRPRACAEDERPDPDDPNDRIPCEACNCTGWKHWIDEKGVIRNAQHYSEL